MRSAILILVIFYYFAKSNANSTDYCSDSDNIEDTVYLWENLFKKINTIMSETSELKSKMVNITEDIQLINSRQKEHDQKLAEFMEKAETQYMDLKNRQDGHNKLVENVQQNLKELQKGQDDHNKLVENVQRNLKELQKGQEDQKESNTQFVNSLKRHFEELEKGQTEYGKNLIYLTNQYMGNNNEWITILRRQDGSVDFNRNWTEYKMGFGNPDGEFFIGLEKLHKLTTEGAPKELLVIVKDFENEQRIAKYDNFRIGNESEKYILKELGKYSGDATDSLAKHKGKMFSTYDQDNDEDSNYCANIYKGGWWYYSCYLSNLCGQYRRKAEEKRAGIGWNDWKGKDTSLKYAEMKIRSKYA